MPSAAASVIESSSTDPLADPLNRFFVQVYIFRELCRRFDLCSVNYHNWRLQDTIIIRILLEATEGYF